MSAIRCIGSVHTYPDIFESATFSFRSKISTSTRVRIRIEFATTRIWIHSSTQDSSGNIGNRACVVKRTKFASCKMHLRVKERKPGNEVVILNTVFTVKDWARSCYVTGENLDLASARFPIHSVFKNFLYRERIQKVADSYAGFT